MNYSLISYKTTHQLRTGQINTAQSIEHQDILKIITVKRKETIIKDKMIDIMKDRMVDFQEQELLNTISKQVIKVEDLLKRINQTEVNR